MTTRASSFLLCYLLIAGGIISVRAQPYLDTVIFGNSSSETAHAFVGPNTSLVTNTSVSPSQTARRGLTNNPVTIYGGSLTFNLVVDPVRRNYFTVKLWGGDEPQTGQDSDMGRLYLYVPATNFFAGSSPTNYFQIGYRHAGDYSCLNAAAYKPPLPGRFFYSTTLLPLWMTQGRTNLTLTIQPGGRIYDLGSGVASSGGNYQFMMFTNSRAIYQAYTHTEAALNPAGEVQGSAPAVSTRPAIGSASVNTLSSGGSYWNSMNSTYANKLSQNITNYYCVDVAGLAFGYWVSNFPGFYTNPVVVTQVVAAVDYFASNYYANPTTSVSAGGNEGWGGRFGYLGWAIDTMMPTLTNFLDVTNNYGVTNATRRQAWGDMLQASRDYGRFGRDGFYLSNQELFANRNIYWANRAMLDLTNANAFAETNAQRYLIEAIGIVPWTGSDLVSGGHSYLLGTNYYCVTPKGLTREWGYVGKDYGELAYFAAEFYEATTNPVFLAQCVKMASVRAPFRRQSVDISSGPNYRAMEAIGLLAWRGAGESDSQYADDLTYGEPVSYGLRCAAVTMDTNIIGYAKQMLNDNQFFNGLSVGLGYENFKAFADYAKVTNATDNGVRLPMTDGQPDFAWADEDTGIVAVKHGNERLWLSTYWQSTKSTGMNGIGRFLYETNTFARYGMLEITPQFTFSGTFLTRGSGVDSQDVAKYTPPDNPTNAYAGERLPTAASDPGASVSEVFVGKANFWICRYGNFLIGINRDQTKSYELKTPTGFMSAMNLVNNQIAGGTVMVAPHSTVVLYLNSATDSSPVPSTPLSLNAVATSAPSVAMDWNPSSGSQGYNVKRSLTSGGPYATIANVNGTNYTDTNVAFGVTYYYVVSGTNANGESAYNSMEASATPKTLINAGFELPASGKISTGFASVPGWESGTMTSSGVEALSPHSGIYRAFFMNGDGAFWQTTPQTISKSNTYTLTYYYLKSGGSGTPAIKVSLVAWNGSTETVLTTQSITIGTSAWTAGTNSVTVPDNTTDGQVLRIKFENIGTGNSSWAGIDDVALVIPGSAPATPATLVAVAGDAQVSLSWNSVSNATSYNVKRSLTSGTGYVTMTNSPGTNVVDIGVTNGSTYYYVVSAANAFGESTNSTQVNATPTASTPAAPAGLTVTGSGPQVSLSWNASTSATNYNVKWTTTSGTGFVTVTNLSGTNAMIGGVDSNVTYYLVVSAVNAVGESANSTQVATLAAPVGLTATSGSAQATLTWLPVSGATAYKVKRSIASGSGYATVTSTFGTSVVDTGLSKGVTYYYLVSALNSTSESSDSAQIKVTPLAVAGAGNAISINFVGGGNGGTPTSMGKLEQAGVLAVTNWNNATTKSGTVSSLGQSDGTTTTASVTWSGNNTWNTTNSDIAGDYRMMKGYLDLSPNGNPTNATVTVTNLPTGYTNNGYSVFVYFNGDSGNDKTGVYTIGLRTNYATDQGGVIFSGEYVQANNSTGNYMVFSNLTSKGFTLVGSGNPTDGNNGRAPINGIQVVANAPAIPLSLVATAGNTQVSLNWNAVGGATGYNLKRWLASASSYVTVANVTGTNAVDAGLANGTTYYYVVTALNAGGESQNSIVASATPLEPVPPAPATVMATPGDAQIALTWSAVSGATGYNVKASLTNGGIYSVVGTNVADLMITNTGLINGVLYYFVVSALNMAGESTNSIQAVARPLSLAPPQLGMSVSLGQLHFFWPTNQIGWRLTAQTNDLGIGLTTNWTTVGNSAATNQMTVPIGATNGSVFFRLVYP